MASRDEFTERIAAAFEKRGVAFETKKMFGGVCFLVDEKMCVGISKDAFMVRFDPALQEEIMGQKGARPLDFTNRVMKGFAFIEEYAIESDEALGKWIDLALDYNPRAKASKKKTKK